MNKYEKATAGRLSYVPSKTRLFSIHLRCGGKIHKIVFRYNGPVCLWSHRYDDSKKIELAAQLGRPRPLCFAILNSIKKHERPWQFPGPAMHKEKFALVAFRWRAHYRDYVINHHKNKKPRVAVERAPQTIEEQRGY